MHHDMDTSTLIGDAWREAVLPPESTIQEAIRNLDRVAIKIVLVVDAAGKLQGTISDGDIRRGLLRGLDLNSPIASIVHRDALLVPRGIARETVVQLMVANKIQQIPVVDEQRHVVGLHLWDEITVPPTHSNLMVIMAGGMGTRLRPQTENCPKPLLPVAGKPMLEHIIDRARIEGFTHFMLAIHYLGSMIEDYFGNGERWNVEIEYLHDPRTSTTIPQHQGPYRALPIQRHRDRFARDRYRYRPPNAAAQPAWLQWKAPCTGCQNAVRSR